MTEWRQQWSGGQWTTFLWPPSTYRPAPCELLCCLLRNCLFSDNICSGPLQATFTPSLHHHCSHQLTNVSINCFFSQHLSFGTTSNTTERFSLQWRGHLGRMSPPRSREYWPRPRQVRAAALITATSLASVRCPLPPRAAAGRRLSWWAAAGVTSNETTSTLLLLENCRGMSISSQKPTLHSWEMSCQSDPTQINNVFKFSNILMVLCTLHTP